MDKFIGDNEIEYITEVSFLLQSLKRKKNYNGFYVSSYI